MFNRSGVFTSKIHPWGRYIYIKTNVIIHYNMKQ